LAITDFLDDKRRTLPATRDLLDREFRPAAVAAKYRELYDTLAGAGQQRLDPTEEA